MNKNDYIALLDPSLQNNEGKPSDNLGDLIIYDSIKLILEGLFPGKEVCRISTHVSFKKQEKEIINKAQYTFVGGTNILTSDIRHFPRLTPVKKKGFYLFPGFKNVILCGAGWAGYQQKTDWATRLYYKNILRRDILHSVRDNYSVIQLNEAGHNNVIHTSCPTTWSINASFENKFDHSYGKILLMLTNYDKKEIEDNKLLEMILSTGAGEIYFFPQSSLDATYISTLPAFQKNKSKFRLLNHELREFYSLISSEKLNYIGNRLHGGIKCLAYDQPAMILSIDNRASEMGKSINLNVAERDNFDLLQRWISNVYVPPPIILPVDNIEQWKNQFILK
jgi:polysaccharide pyruvyl transferase WcaK-like protein